MSKISRIIRTIILILLVFAMLFLCVLRLLQLQVVEGADYLALAETSYISEYEVIATRGQIFDVNNVVLSSNRTVYKVIFQKAFLINGTENEVIDRTVSVLEENGEKWNDSVPISYSKPYVFTTDDEEIIDSFKKRIRVNLDATADNCITELKRKYGISETDFSESRQRIIAGIRYEMELKDFSYDNRFTLADDVSLNTVIRLKEDSLKLSGIDIIEESAREYVESSTAPHVLGTVGALSYEEYQTLKSEGYSYNDIIGTYGVEKAMESVLRGENGLRSIARDSNGNAVSDDIIREAVAGDSVKITIDSEFQNDLQQILSNQINWLNNTADRGNDCDAGAVVVLNAKTGAVLGMATYPTYDLCDSIENYSEVLNAEGNPMYNRCINGLYRPGSAFKTITAADGLVNGLIDKNSRAECTGVYTFYSASDYRPKCTGYHLGYDVVNCLKWSCNIFFYDLGRRLGIDELCSFAQKFGYGENLGLEIGGLSGQMSSPEVFEKLRGEPWTDGNTLQAAIGQMDTLVTPLHLSVQALTLANDGVRMKPYIIDSVWNYEGTEMIYKTEPVVIETIENENNAFEIVREGMIAVSTLVTWPTSSSLWNFDYLPYSVAIKTGTAETGDGYYTSTVMGYYPAEDPQIAFGIVLEKGEYSRYMVRNIIDAYFYDCYEPDVDENGIILTPWKRWENAKKAIR